MTEKGKTSILDDLFNDKPISLSSYDIANLKETLQHLGMPGSHDLYLVLDEEQRQLFTTVIVAGIAAIQNQDVHLDVDFKS